MNRWIQHRLACMLAGIVCAGLAATWAVGEVLDTHKSVRQDKHEVARMTEKMKTICVGRFLIDLPEEAHVELTGADVKGFKIAAFDETREAFETRLAEREAQIKSKPDRRGGNRNLESVREVKTESGLTGKIFVHEHNVTEGTQGNGLQLERYRYEDVTVEALVHADGVSIDLVSEERNPKYIDDLPVLISKLVANPGNPAPTAPGFCLHNAYLRDPLPAEQGERISMFASMPSHPDVEFMLILAAGLKPDEQGLLARSEAANERLSLSERMRISKLRAAPREIAGMPGEELVELFVEQNDARVHSFWWEVNGTQDNVYIPHFVFKMNTGSSAQGPVPSSLSDGAAIGLWDKITSSIRVRPVAAPTIQRIDPPMTPIGTLASAGEPCPESGWWLCGDGGNGVGVLGGQRQYIKKGEPMPQALLLPPQTLWDKVRGLQPSFEAKHRTTWKLVDHRARKRHPPSLPLAKPASPGGATLDVTVSGGADSNGIAIGSFSSTGAPCPASGWWRCEESHALDGTRWFAQGSLLPPATFTVAPGIFGYSPGAPQAIQRRSAWRLMRLAAAPGDEDRSSANVASTASSSDRQA